MVVANRSLLKIQRKARASAVEVEDILALAASGSREDAAPLRDLATQLEWSRGSGGHANQVPIGRWSDITCAFLEGGYAAVESFTCDSASLPFAVGLLSELKTPESIGVLNQLVDRFRDLEARTQIAGALNLICLRGAPLLDSQALTATRAWLHELLAGAATSQAIAACAPRKVGNTESIELLSQLAPLPAPWAGIEKQAIRAIRKRLRTS
jgi:hypothetical protein